MNNRLKYNNKLYSSRLNFFILGGIQGFIGWGSGQPKLMGGKQPIAGLAIRLLDPFQPKSFCNAMILRFYKYLM